MARTWTGCAACRSGAAGQPKRPGSIRAGWRQRCCCRWILSGPVTRAAYVRAVMDLLAVLSAAGVRRSLVHAAARVGLAGRDGPVPALAAEVVDGALARLAGASLLTFSVDGSAVSAHRLVMRVIRENLAAGGALTAVCQAAARLLDGLVASLEERWHEDRAVTRDLVEQILALR